jgi:hypothetical protein
MENPSKKRKPVVTYSRKSKHVHLDEAPSESNEITSFKPLTEEIYLDMHLETSTTLNSQTKKKKTQDSFNWGSSFSSSNATKEKQKKNPPAKMEQSFLDLGQKNFGRVACQGCAMVYNPGLDEDELVHQNFHKRFMDNLKCVDFPVSTHRLLVLL